MKLRPATKDELNALTELCLRAKAVWGYDEAFLAACRPELTLREVDLARSDVFVAEDGEGMVHGVAQVVIDGNDAWLEKLFVDPQYQGHGIGRVLYDWSIDTARRRGANRLVIDADPDAEAFYLRMGAHRIGQTESNSIPGRFLPQLAHVLAVEATGQALP